MQSVYERYKEQIEDEIKRCNQDIKDYRAETDPKWANAYYDAIDEKDKLEKLLKFLEENKEVLDK